ncbi:MAG: hypothetical protein P8R54_30800 [Myxococcota bacterium]|nr:hypothetical protein [Myxococcota bacterium]
MTPVLSERTAHEAAHDLSLMHPAQLSPKDDSVVARDALDDTDGCMDDSDCEDELGDDLMYPFAGCWWDSECDSQDDLTEDHGTVMRR